IIGIINMIIFNYYICGNVINGGSINKSCMYYFAVNDYFSVFDYKHRTIMLFDQNKLKIKLLQLGNPNKSSLEFNVSIQWYNDIDIDDTHAKWVRSQLYLALPHNELFDRDDLSNWYQLMKAKTYKCHYQLSNKNYQLFEFNSFHVIWKDQSDNITNKEPLSPYSITFKQGKKHDRKSLLIFC
ncbi:hypothetical protein RFI_26141, partial [Reticulomyxa filosa]